MILVTGATGFLGSALVRQLATQNKPIRAIKRPNSRIPAQLKHLNIQWFDGDLLDYFSLQEAFEGVSHVYHCAAMISFNPADKQPMWNINVQGTAHVVNLCLAHQVKKLVHVSSVASLGVAKLGQYINEESHWESAQKQTNYAISKYESEMEVFRAIAEGLNAVVVNPSVILGKQAGKRGSGAFFEMIKRGLDYYPSGCCGLVDVDDVVRSMIALMEGDFSAERYILSAENWPFKDFFSEIATQLQLSPPRKELKPWMISVARLVNFVKHLLKKTPITLSADVARNMVRKSNYVNAKIKAAIQIEFKPIKQSIAEVCRAS